jgi:hypothetical protein
MSSNKGFQRVRSGDRLVLQEGVLSYLAQRSRLTIGPCTMEDHDEKAGPT